MKKEIIAFLNLTEEQYAQLQFETGMTYLEQYLDNSIPLIQDFATHKGFWNWWRRQFDIVDMTFIYRYENSSENIHTLREYYIHMHLVADKHIDKVLWEMIEEERDQMTHKLIKQEVGK